MLVGRNQSLTFFIAHIVHETADPSSLSSVDEDLSHWDFEHHGYYYLVDRTILDAGLVACQVDEGTWLEA